MIIGVVVGFVIGVVCTGLIAWMLLRRHVHNEVESERRARAAERMAEIGALTGGLAHEIKNPLSTIGLNAQLLTEAVEDTALPDDDRRRLLNRLGSLRREVERLSGILSDFLEFAGKPHLERMDSDANELVQDLVDFYSPEAERRGVRLRADLSPEPVIARLDVKRVKQAVLNLMINATQAMDAASKDATGPNELILRTREVSEGGERFARIDVTDTGPGIAPEKLDQIFKPYFSMRSGGSGLGLPTARQLVEAHGGRIRVHSEVGKGTDFSVLIPATTPAAEV